MAELTRNQEIFLMAISITLILAITYYKGAFLLGVFIGFACRMLGINPFRRKE